MQNVVERNAGGKQCSGCGACVAACSKGCIQVEENERGELRPKFLDDVCTHCGICVRVCPFIHAGVAKDDAPTCFIGRAEEYERDGSSGGVATWFLAELLRQGVVDACVCVAPQSQPSELFRYVICRTAEDLRKCQGSAYYPVTLQEVLNDISAGEETVAIVTVPCFATALRNLRELHAFWKQRIRLVVGLVCGHMPSKRMVDCLVWSRGYERDDIESCRFRIPAEDKPAWDYGMRLRFRDGNEFTSFGSEDFGFLFWHRLFAQKCCNACDDVFARNADVTFMDAWLPEYKELRTGTSMVLCRDQMCEDILAQLVERGSLEECLPGRAEEAQHDLVKFKSRAGEHLAEDMLIDEVARLCESHVKSPRILDELRRLCYMQDLRRKNRLLWTLITTKDRIVGR